MNYVFWVGVKSKDSVIREKHGDFKYLDISEKFWRRWCKKHNVEFVPYTIDNTTELDNNKHKVTWTRWFDIMDILPESLTGWRWIVDGSSLIINDPLPPWEVVDLDENKVHGFRSLENLRWIHEGIAGYTKKLFPDLKFDFGKYISCGNQVFTEKHYWFLKELKKYYFENYDDIMSLQHGSVKRGTDQPVYNCLLQKYDNIHTADQIPPDYMITHINRFHWDGHNWQINDTTPFFIKYGKVLFFSGFVNRGDRYQLMEYVNQNYNV